MMMNLSLAFVVAGLCTVGNVDSFAFDPVSRNILQTPGGFGGSRSLIRPTSSTAVRNIIVMAHSDVSVINNIDKLDEEVLSLSSFGLLKKKYPKTKSSPSTASDRRVVKQIAFSALYILSIIATISYSPVPAYAAKKNAVIVQQSAKVVAEHLHTGQKIANYFRSFGIPDLAVLAIISAMPVVELRGAVPVGVWMGLPITTVLPVCVLGNMIPIVPILFLLRNDKLKKLMKPILARAEKKSASLGVGSIEKQWASLAAFVGIPLPGTGAWTGAMGAFLLGMPTAVALSSIFTGVVAAGVIMTAITLAGKRGGICALAALALITGREFFAASEGDGTSEGEGVNQEA